MTKHAFTESVSFKPVFPNLFNRTLLMILCRVHLCWLCLSVCPAVSQSVSQSAVHPARLLFQQTGLQLHCLRYRTRSRSRRLSVSQDRRHDAAVINAVPPAARRILTASLTVWGNRRPASGEMSAVSPEHIQTGEQNRTGDESELQKVGLLEPQTVFVILDSSETLNLVRWVCILGPTQLEPEPAANQRCLWSCFIYGSLHNYYYLLIVAK